MEHYIYILFSKSRGQFYIGETENLEARILKHNRKQVKSTKGGTPWKIIWNCAVENRSAARRLERKIKSRGAKRHLQDIGLL